MQVALVQLDTVWERPEANHEKVRQLLSNAPPQPGALIVLPEMFASGFSMNVAAIADENHATQQFLQQIAREHQSYVVAGLVLRGSKLGRNCAVVIDPNGEIIANYCKLHPFSHGKEDQCYEPGDDIVTFRWRDFTVAPFVCYDLRFPEIFRAAVRRGANMFSVIANWPDTRVQHWVTLLQARAIENQAYVVGVNRVGSDPTLRYPGQSLVVDPMGRVVVDAGDREGVFYADLNIDLVWGTRRRLPFLKDMRGD